MSEESTLDEFTDAEDEENSEENRITGFGTFPSGWKKRDITECAEIRDSERIPLNSQEREEKKPGNIPYYGANGVLDYIDEHIFESELILLAEDGGHFEEYRERPIAYRISGKAWVNNHAHILEARDDTVADYLFYSLEHRNLVPYVSGSTRSKLTQSMLRKVKIPSPPLSEQRKIATVLYTVDRAIEKTEEIIEQTNRVRDGFIKQRVLATDSNEVRKEGIVGTRRVTIPETWSTVRLGDVAEIVSGKSFPREYQEGNVGSNAVIKVEDMNRPDNDKYIKNVTNRISDETLDKLNKNVFPAEAVIHPRVGEALLLNKMRLTTEKAAFDDNIMGWVPDEINPEYLYYASTMIDFNAVAQTGTVPSINKEMASNFRFPLPPKDEQMNIVEDLQRIDGQVSIYEREKNQLQRLKRGLQQDLLSGTVRTTDTKIEVPDEIVQHG